MQQHVSIIDLYAREILDSRGNPTVEVEILLENNVCERASVPSGASTGQYEAVELRDGGERYHGKGVRKAVDFVNEMIAPEIIGMNVFEQRNIDKAMIALDGTDKKERLGANAILAVSLAVAHAASASKRIPLYEYIGGITACTLPVPMMNILNGGVHAPSSGLDIQEFMIMPVGACCFRKGLRMCAEVYHTLGKILKQKKMSVSVGDEGGYAPDIYSNEEAISLIISAVEQSGYRMEKDFMIALDAAASEWKERGGNYLLPKTKKKRTSDELIDYWVQLVNKYPIYSIEDPLDEEDWEGWEKLTAKVGQCVQLVGDDLFVTNTKRLKQGIKMHCGNAILIKLNQIGTLTETIEAIKMAHEAGYKAIVSHRSGETEDVTIADLAVALNTGQIKTGAPCRGERIAKYNRLLRIEEKLSERTLYPVLNLQSKSRSF